MRNGGGVLVTPFGIGNEPEVTEGSPGVQENRVPVLFVRQLAV
jgi:hypothetical protein